MPVLMQSRPGAVIALEDDSIQCTARVMSLDPVINFDAQTSIVTRMTMSQQVNVQFLHTLGSYIFIYVFGDRIGTIGLSGLAFNCKCPDSQDHGAKLVYQWYKTNRASKRKEPIRLTIGADEAIDGFVTGFTEDVVDAAVGLVQWNANIMTLPED